MFSPVICHGLDDDLAMINFCLIQARHKSAIKSLTEPGVDNFTLPLVIRKQECVYCKRNLMRRVGESINQVCRSLSLTH